MKLPSIFAVLALGILLPVAAAAQSSPTDRASARALGLEGEAALDSQDYVKAADRFVRAEALFHAPTLLLGLARAQVGLGKLVDAQETYRRLVSEPVPPDAPPIFLEAVSDGQKELAAVGPRLAWLTISVTGGAAATVRLDEAILSPAALGVRRAVDPGTHQILALAPGGSVKKTSVTLAEGRAETITLDLGLLPGLSSALGAPAAPESGIQPVPPHSRAPVYVLFAAGGVTAIVAAVFTGLAASSHSAFDNATPPTQALADVVQRNALIADVTWASAGTIGAAGLVTLLVMRASESPKGPPGGAVADRLFVTPWFGTVARGISAGIRF